jgi:uncharacterized protein
MVDITPLIPAGRQIIERYAPGAFRVSGVTYQGALLVLPDRTLAWPIASFADITLSSLSALTDPSHPAVELLLVGCGEALRPLPRDLRQALRQAGIVAEAMDTGAACRTYNVLMAEDRRVAAALLPVGG